MEQKQTRKIFTIRKFLEYGEYSDLYLKCVLYDIWPRLCDGKEVVDNKIGPWGILDAWCEEVEK